VERNNPVLSRSPEPREGASEGNELVATHSLCFLRLPSLDSARDRQDRPGRGAGPGPRGDQGCFGADGRSPSDSCPLWEAISPIRRSYMPPRGTTE
jgi:hypothetical protein